MIDNLENQEVKERLDTQGNDPVIPLVVECLNTSEHPYSIHAGSSGLDFTCNNKIKGVDNRAHVKLFYPKENTLLVFFYKKSNVPWSRDRFAYGGIEYDMKGRNITDDDIRTWLDFAESGFSPERRPEHLLRLFPYDIPS